MLGLNFGATSSSGGGGAYDFENALLFDGVNDYLLTDPAVDVDVSGDFIISWWFKSGVTGGGAGSQMLATSASEGDYILLGSLDRVRIKINSTSYDTAYSWSADSDWHHYCYYRDSGVIKLVIDGVDYGTVGTNTNVVSYRYIGRRGSSTSLMLDGTIDDWFVSEETVTLAEVQDIYNGGAGNNPTTVISGTPKQYINFNQSSPDSTATAQNGSDMALNNFDTAICWVAH
jgi:hypothetical protein